MLFPFIDQLKFTIWTSCCSTKVLGTSMSYPDLFLYLWIGMGAQILSPNILEQRLPKDVKPSWEVQKRGGVTGSQFLDEGDFAKGGGGGGGAVLHEKN